MIKGMVIPILTILALSFSGQRACHLRSLLHPLPLPLVFRASESAFRFSLSFVHWKEYYSLCCFNREADSNPSSLFSPTCGQSGYRSYKVKPLVPPFPAANTHTRTPTKSHWPAVQFSWKTTTTTSRFWTCRSSVATRVGHLWSPCISRFHIPTPVS